MPDTRTPAEVFYAYAPEDGRWLAKLEKHLSLLKHQKLISTWHPGLLAAGAEVAHDIAHHLNSAALILLLISPDFLASDVCYDGTLQRALERHKASEARVIPILLRPVADWQSAPFAHLLSLPTDGKFISTWSNQDVAFADIAAGIRRALEDVSLLPTSLPRVDFPPLWNVPFARNPFFLDRDELFVRLRLQLSASQAAAFGQPHAISGLGGIGKTQVAIEYAYRFRRDYQAVFWVRADSSEALISSYVTIANMLNLPEKDAREQEVVVQAVQTWLRTHQQWLLILDNADELDLLPSFLPPTLGGHSLLTTRAAVLGRLAGRIEVETFDLEQGALFLLRRAGLLAPDATLGHSTPEDRSLALQVTHELGGLPLALDQAGAYLEATGSSLANYQQIYQQHRIQLLQERRGHPFDHPEPVATTWSLAFQRVKEKNLAAAELLLFCAFLAPDPIPEEMIVQGADELGSVLTLVAADAYLLNQAIEALRTYSLLGRDPKTHTLTMHRLVQTVLYDTLPLETRGQWMQRVVNAVNAAFPESNEYANWPVCERCLPHALLCITWMKQQPIVSLQAARLLHQVGRYLRGRARYAEAQSMHQHALEIYEQLHPEHSDALTNLRHLADLYMEQGKSTEAERFYQKLLAIHEKAYGAEHPEVVTDLDDLAYLYAKQRKYTEAEIFYQKGLLIREQQLGPEHPDTARSLSYLADLCVKQEKYPEAEIFYQRALAIREHQSGPEYTDTARSLRHLAYLYVKQGKYAQAEPLYQRALAIRKQHLGPEHPYTAISLGFLADLYVKLEKYREAEPLYQQALAINKKVYGAEHPKVGVNLSDLAHFYMEQEKYTEAEPLYQRALIIYEKVYGADHPKVATHLNGLANLYIQQEKYAEAETLYQRALAIRVQHLSPEHPYTVRSMGRLGDLYKKQRKYTEAESFYQRVIAMNEKVYGREHLYTAIALNRLADLYVRQEKYVEAELLYQRALAIRERQLGPEHPDVARSLRHLVDLYMKQEKYTKGEPLYQRALAIYEQRLGNEHPDTLEMRENYAMLLRTTNQGDEATPGEREGSES